MKHLTTIATAVFATTATAFSSTPQPVLRGEATIASSFPDDRPCAVSEDSTVGFRITGGEDSPEPLKLHSIDIGPIGVMPVLQTIDIDAQLYGNALDLAMRVSGDRLYLLSPLTIIDISDPTNMTILGQHPDGFPTFNPGPSAIAVQGTTVYIVGPNRDIKVFDCTDPTNIVSMGTIQLPGSRSSISIETLGNDQLVIGRDWDGITIHDSSAPGMLPTVGSVSGFQANSMDVDEQNGIVYTIRRDTSRQYLTSVDISNPNAPVMLDQENLDDLQLFGGAGAIAVVNEQILAVYIEYGRIELFDVSDPANIIRMAPILTSAANLASTNAGELVVSSRDGIEVYEFNACAADLTGDGSLDFFDVSAFLAAFSAQDPIADFNADGQYNFFDVSEFLNLFNTGCP
ncbi:MAG: hypothetical protein CMJ25_23905 [Phycisphaerae bacterium]|nr:hypothetical protein [Phycisphaerae bacterium]